MEDVSLSDLQRTAAKWIQGAEAQEVGGSEKVRKAGIDFSADNVTITPHQNGTVAPKGAAPEIPVPEKTMDAELVEKANGTVNSICNALQIDDAERDRMVSTLLVLSEQAAAGNPKAHRAFMDIYKALALISEFVNKHQEVMTNEQMFLAQSRATKLEQQKQDILDTGPNTTLEFIKIGLSLAGGLTDSVSSGGFLGEKGNAVASMFSQLTNAGAQIVDQIDQAQKVKKEAKLTDSQKSLALITGLSEGVKGLKGTMQDLAGKIQEVREDASKKSGKGISLA